jgi:hypothetical protein
MSDKEILFCVIVYISNVEFTSQPVPRDEADKLYLNVQALPGVSNFWMTRADEIDRLLAAKYADRRNVAQIVEDERRGQ